MATVTINNLQTRLNDTATEVTSMSLVATIETLNLSTGASVTQVIITNKSALDVYLKFWDSSSTPTGSAGGSWNTEPTMILPAVANETADYSFLGDNLYQFAAGWKLNISDQAGILVGNTGSPAIDVDVLIFTT
tara:strand:- start:3443 stop:3844 length:402 start_codon:yes stop_codon:yes gene_type:complete